MAGAGVNSILNQLVEGLSIREILQQGMIESGCVLHLKW